MDILIILLHIAPAQQQQTKMWLEICVLYVILSL